MRCLFAISFAAVSAVAQHANKLSVAVDPSVRERLARAEDALRADDRDRAILMWQAILDGVGGRVLPSHHGPRNEFVTERTVVPGDRYVGARRHVLGLLRALPDDGLARYREVMEPRASRVLAPALRDGDETQLRAIVRRFILTESGRKAGLALIDLLIEEGRFDEARLAVQRLRDEDVAVPDDNPFAIQLIAREALALWGAREAAGLEELTAIAQASFTDRRLTIGGKDVALSAFVADLSAHVRSHMRVSARPALLHSRIEPNWSRAFQTDDWSDTVGAFPVMTAIKDDLVYYGDGRHLRARRLVSGTDYWRPIESPIDEYDAVGDPDVDHRVLLDGDLVIGFLESAPMMENPWRSRRRAVAGFKLVAADRKTGKVKWSHFAFLGKDAEETEFLSKFSVCQPPLAVGDTLYVSGTVLKGIFHHWICAIDRDTGNVRWRTYVGAGQTEVSRGGNPTRASVPGYVAEHRGMLYYSTNMGIICAVDAMTGAIEWQSAYDQDRPRYDDWGGWGRRRSRYSIRSTGWRQSRPVVMDGKLFITPEDTSSLYIAELATGKLSTLSPAFLGLPAQQACLVGAHNGHLILAGSRMAALDTGKLSVSWRFPDRTQLDGARTIRGVPSLDGNQIAVTTSGASSQLEILDADTGKVTQRRPLRDLSRVGNVAIHQGSVVIATDDSVSAFVRE